MGYELLIGLGSLVLGIVLVVVAIPKATGGMSTLGPGSNLKFIYPVLPLLFLVIGAAMLIQALP